jgi:hypothetical protein
MYVRWKTRYGVRDAHGRVTDLGDKIHLHPYGDRGYFIISRDSIVKMESNKK